MFTYDYHRFGRNQHRDNDVTRIAAIF